MTHEPNEPNPLSRPAALPAAPTLLQKPRRLSRRNLLKAFTALAATGTATYAYGHFFEAHRLVVEHLTLPIPGLAPRWHNQRLVQLSDLHAGRTSPAHIQRALEIARDLRPAALLITGDFVDNIHVDPAEIANLLRPFAAQVPTYGITGNHDFGARFQSPAFASRVCDALTNAGIRMLRNALHQPHPGPGELCFVGIDDFWNNNFRPATLAAAPPDASIILLSHNPDSYEALAPYRFHLMLSGHTHGGQVCLPFFGPLILPVQHRERAAGLFHLDPREPHRALYVTRGIGHLLQIRLYCPPEITCLTLHNPAL